MGLTASIMKDPVTGMMTLEAGALMLADQGNYRRCDLYLFCDTRRDHNITIS